MTDQCLISHQINLILDAALVSSACYKLLVFDTVIRGGLTFAFVALQGCNYRENE